MWAYPTGTLSYRMTVEVEAGGSVHRGSSVLEARFVYQPKWTFSQNRVVGGLRGEAVEIDLGNKEVLFVLLTGSQDSSGNGFGADPEAIPVRLFLGTAIGSLVPADIAKLSSLQASADLATSDLPMMVRFGKIIDPTTVELVDPRDLSATLGPHARVVRASIETTSDAPVKGIEATIPWLARVERQGGAVDGTRFPSTNELRGNLGGLAFRRGSFL